MSRRSWVTLWVVLGATQGLAQEEDPWKAPAMSRDDFTTFLRFELKSIDRRLGPELSARLSAELAALERKVADPVDRVSLATQLSALLEGLGARDAAQRYAHWAAVQTTESKVAVANYAALSCWPPLLKLAIELDPRHPVPHTNFASCAMSDGRWELARAAYEQSLVLAPGHRTALLGLGTYWMHVPDLRRAFEYFAKANGVHYQQSTESARDERGEQAPPSAPLVPREVRRGGGAVDASPRAAAGGDRLVLPELPKWPSPDAFLASASARAGLAAFYGEKMAAGLKRADALVTSRPLEALAALPAEGGDSKRVTWSDLEVGRAMSLNYAWAKQKLTDADVAWERAAQERQRLLPQIVAIAEERNRKAQAACPPNMGPAELVACFKKVRADAVSSCRQTTALSGRLFASWRDAYAAWYAAARPVLEETWRVQDLWLAQLADEQLFSSMALLRDTFVFSPLAAKMMEEDVMRMSLAGLGATSFGVSAEVCPTEPPVDLPPAEQPTTPHPRDPRHDCPLPKDGLKLPPFDVPGVKLPFSFTVWCKEAEFKLTTGLSEDKKAGAKAAGVFSVRHRFGSDKSTTVYVGVEAGLKVKSAGAELGVKGELGLSLRFSRRGELEELGGRAGVSESLTLPADAAKGSMGVTAAIEKGAPDVAFKYSGAVKQLPF